MKITIIGGGMAGWLTASYLKKEMSNLDITLIEDPAISKTLVGESIAPTVTDFILSLGIDEQHFIKETNASYKLGTRFSEFTNLDKGYDYASINVNFSPDKLDTNSQINARDFITDSEILASDLLLELVKRKELTDFIKYWNPHHSYMKKNVGFNSLFDNDKFPLERRLARSLHINAETTAEYIRDNVAIPHGVKHIQQTVKNVITNGTNVESLELSDGTTITSDLFIDCSGGARVLVKKLDWPVKYYTDNKIDRAVVCQLGYDDKETELVNYTDIKACPHGWMFRIPLYHRMGCGYCFSSSHVSEEEAIEYYKSQTKNHLFTPKVIRWKPNRLEKIADGNVVAIGMSVGFIEPLEANALRIVITTIKNLEETIRNNSNFDKLNKNVISTIDDVATYISMFHSLSKRTDTEYWKDMTEIGEKNNHATLLHDIYMSKESTALNMYINNSLRMLDQHWLQLYLLQNSERNLDKWESLEIDETTLAKAKDYFEGRFNYLDELSSTEPSFYTWIKETIFKHD